eukprot:6085597-Pleurochrysis_carterae.AAC.1
MGLSVRSARDGRRRGSRRRALPGCGVRSVARTLQESVAAAQRQTAAARACGGSRRRRRRRDVAAVPITKAQEHQDSAIATVMGVQNLSRKAFLIQYGSRRPR